MEDTEKDLTKWFKKTKNQAHSPSRQPDIDLNYTWHCEEAYRFLRTAVQTKAKRR